MSDDKNQEIHIDPELLTLKDKKSPDADKQHEKIKKTDKSLKIPKRSINKKSIKIVISIFAVMCIVALIIAFSPSTGNKGKKEDEKKSTKTVIPQYLKKDESDYAEMTDKENESGQDLYTTGYNKENTDSVLTADEKTIKNTDDSVIQYKTYSRETGDETKKETDVVVKKKTYNQNQYTGTGGGNTAKNEPQIRRNPILIQVPKKNSLTEKDATGDDDKYKYLDKQINAASMTDYDKQNQQDKKQEWLKNQQLSYSDYLDSKYIESVDFEHELKAGTIIPITLMTAISSDLPGTITAQVIVNIFDTNTGINILVPRGSRVIGEYDSQIAFGQDRLLMAWKRIIRPDGISINLKSMPGVDASGKSGIKGDVDNHYGEILAASTMSSIFDLSMDAATAWLSSSDTLHSLANVLTTSEEDGTDNVKQKIVEKILNQQPSIEIKAGTRANIIVTQDIILPEY